MKRLYVFSKNAAFLVAISVATAFFVSACGKFSADPNAFGLRPPTSSSPLKAEQERQEETFVEGNDIPGPVLDSDDERQTFLEDLTEQKRTHTDDQLADEAQSSFERRQSEKAAEAANQAQKPPPAAGEPVAVDPAPAQGPAVSAGAAAPGESSPSDPNPPSTATGNSGGASGDLQTNPAQPENQSAVGAPEPGVESPDGSTHGVPKVPDDVLPPQAPPAQSVDANTPVPSQVPATAPPQTQTPSRPRPAPTAVPKAPSAPPPALPPPPPPPKRGPVAKPAVPSIRSQLCEKLNVNSGQVEMDLSPLYNDSTALPATMPSADLNNSPGTEKKNMFICIMLPIAIRMNAEVFSQRLEILRLAAKSKKGSLTKEDQTWLSQIKEAYRVDAAASFADLLKRVDIIPLPLLLAQAALESSWGASRATRVTNNLFGIHATKGQPCVMGFDTNNACLRKFNTIGESVSAYIRLLNVGTAYSHFRDSRGQMRKNEEPLDSVKLLTALGSYSELGADYINLVRNLMSVSNKLTKYEFKEEQVAAAQPGGQGAKATGTK